MIRETKDAKKGITEVWLDLANAYGSIPHQLIYTALQHYRKIITSYLDGIKLRFSVGDKMTNRQKLEKRIVTG